MRLTMSWVYRFFVILASLVFVYFYFEPAILLSVNGFYAIFLYSSLSIITGLRYKNVVHEVSGVEIGSLDILRIPAAMNLASYLLPVKGGGVWLFLYLKSFYGFSSSSSLFLVFFNLFFLLHLFFLILISIFIGFYLSFLVVSIWVLLYFFILLLIRFALRFFLNKLVSIKFAVIDTLLVGFHFTLLSSLCYVLVGPLSLTWSFLLALFLLISGFIKVTPGNIGILEGAAILASQILPENGELFPILVASYRSLSILHALVAGIPSMVSLSFTQQVKVE